MKQNTTSYDERHPYYQSSSSAQADKDTDPLAKPTAPPYYGTFQGTPAYAQPSNTGQQYAYDTVQGYPVTGQTPMDAQRQRLPCCGIGVGWFLFIVGWFLAAIPWFVGAFLLYCTRYDYRERTGLVFCTVAAVLSVIAAALGGSRAAGH